MLRRAAGVFKWATGVATLAVDNRFFLASAFAAALAGTALGGLLALLMPRSQ